MYVESVPLGIEVYGQEQFDYTVNGVENRLFGEAVKHASIDRATAVEKGVLAYQAQIRRRQEKLRELGTALAAVSEASAQLAKAKNSTDTFSSSLLSDASKVLDKYGVKCHINGGSIAKENVQRQSQEIQHALEMADNDMQQDMTSIQGFMSKRDKAFQLASKLTSKAEATLSQVIQKVS